MDEKGNPGVVTYNPFSVYALEAVVSMSPSQLEILATAGESDVASCAYNNTVRISVDGELDLPAFTKAAGLLIGRHQSLRATFHLESRTMCIASEMDAEVKSADVSQLDVQSRYINLEKIGRSEAETPFDLVTGPLIRFHTVKTNEKVFFVFMVSHQLVVDHWTLDLLADEIAELYSSIVEARASELPPAVPYVQYARWLQDPSVTDRYSDNLKYWLSKLREPREYVAIAGSMERAAIRGYRASRSVRRISDDLAASVLAQAATEKSTFFVATLACYVSLLSRIAGPGWICIGIPAAGQLQFGQNRLAGGCINTLPLVIEMDPAMTFRECLQAVRKEMYAAQSYTPFTYTEVLSVIDSSGNDGRLPIITTMFNVDQENHVLKLSGVKASYTIEERSSEKFEISMNVVNNSQGSEVQCYFNDDIFLADDRSHFLNAYVTVLGKFVEDPNLRICDVEIDTGLLERAVNVDHSKEPRLGDRFAAQSSGKGNRAFGTVPSEAFARWQVDAVTDEFDLSIRLRPTSPKN